MRRRLEGFLSKGVVRVGKGYQIEIDVTPSCVHEFLKHSLGVLQKRE